MILNKKTKVNSFYIYYFFYILKAIIKLKKFNNKVFLKNVFLRKNISFIINTKNNEIVEIVIHYNKDSYFKLNKDGTLKEYYKCIYDNIDDFVYYRGNKYIYKESSMNSDNKETDRYYFNNNSTIQVIKKNLINNSKTIYVFCNNIKNIINQNIYKEIKYFDLINNNLVYRKSLLFMGNKK